MATLHDVMVFLAKNYPYPSELANARLTKMIYLADWRAAITRGQQVTDLAWEFNHYGPYLRDVIDEANSNSDFNVYTGQTMYGSPKQIIAVREGATASLEPWEEEALRHVIAETKDLNWSQFIELVYSTYPILSRDRYTSLDLVELAKQYKAVQETLPRPAGSV